MGAEHISAPSPKRRLTKSVKLTHLYHKLYKNGREWIFWKDLDREFPGELHEIMLSPTYGDTTQHALRMNVSWIFHKGWLRRRAEYNPGTDRYLYSISKTGIKVLKNYGLATQEDLDQYDWENR